MKEFDQMSASIRMPTVHEECLRAVTYLFCVTKYIKDLQTFENIVCEIILCGQWPSVDACVY